MDGWLVHMDHSSLLLPFRRFLIEFEAAEFWDEQVGLLLTVLVDNPGKDDMRVKVHFCCSRSEQLAWYQGEKERKKKREGKEHEEPSGG